MGSKLSKFLGMVMVLTLLFMVGMFTVYLLEEVARRPGGEGAVMAGLIALGVVAWFLFRGPVGKALASMLEGGTPEADPMLGMRVADVEDRLQELSLETQRLMEIEERLDFTERLLAQHTDPGRLARGEERP